MGKERHRKGWKRKFDTCLAKIKFVWCVAEKSEESTMTAWKVALTLWKDRGACRCSSVR